MSPEGPSNASRPREFKQKRHLNTHILVRASVEDFGARRGKIQYLLVVHDDVNHGSAPKILEIKRKLGSVASFDSGVGALPRGLRKTLTDNELVRSVVLTRDAESLPKCAAVAKRRR
jgi:hypothetical protein